MDGSIAPLAGAAVRLPEAWIASATGTKTELSAGIASDAWVDAGAASLRSPYVKPPRSAAGWASAGDASALSVLASVSDPTALMGELIALLGASVIPLAASTTELPPQAVIADATVAWPEFSLICAAAV